MLKIISILTLLYFLSCTALPESNNVHDVNQRYKDLNRQPLPLQLAEAASRNYYEAGGKQLKPCPRSQGNSLDDQGLHSTPTYSARVVTYQGGASNNLKPQSLKNLPSEDSSDSEEHYNKLLQLYSHYPNNVKDKTDDSEKLDGKTAQKDKQVKVLSDDDNRESANRNALQNGENAQYENQKNKAASNELNDSQYLKSLAKQLNDAKKNYKYTKSDNEKVDGDSYESSDANSDKLNADNDSENKELDNSQYDVKNSKNVQAQSKELDDAQPKSSGKFLSLANYKTKSADSDSDELDAAVHSVENSKNADSDSDELDAAVHSVEHTKNADSDSDELDASVHSVEYTKSLGDKELEDDDSSEFQNNDKKGLYYKPNQSKVYGKYTQNLGDKVSKELQDDENSGSQDNNKKGLYYKPNESKVYGYNLNSANYKNNDYSDEQDSETSEQRSGYSDELEDALNGVKKNKADSDELNEALGLRNNKDDSDELNEALDEIKKHLDHSEELKSALREVGKKGKDYSNVLNKALYKVKKHKAVSDELNGRNGEGSSESDSSDEDDSNDQNETSYPNIKYESVGSKHDDPLLKKSKVLNLSLKPAYKGSDLQSQAEDSDENVQKCPSKQRNSATEQQVGKDSTRRLLSNSEDSESESLEDVSQNNAKLKNKAKYSNANVAQKHALQLSNSEDSEPESLENDSQNNAKLKNTAKYSSANVAQKLALQKTNAEKDNDDEDDSQTAEEKDGDVNDLQGSSGNNALLASLNLANPKTKFGYDLSNPVQAPGVSELPPQGLSLIDHRRVCYACSSDFNPTCFQPSRLTTVKYCAVGHDNCITKSYTDPNDQHQVVIRDCGDSCSVGVSLTGGTWNSCDVCTDDLCNNKRFEPNGAFSINSQSLVFTVFVIFAIKFTI